MFQMVIFIIYTVYVWCLDLRKCQYSLPIYFILFLYSVMNKHLNNNIYRICFSFSFLFFWDTPGKFMIHIITGDPLHSRVLADSCAPLLTQPCTHCSHSRAPGEQWAGLCVFTLQGCVQAARLCRGSPVIIHQCHFKVNGCRYERMYTGEQ